MSTFTISLGFRSVTSAAVLEVTAEATEGPVCLWQQRWRPRRKSSIGFRTPCLWSIQRSFSKMSAQKLGPRASDSSQPCSEIQTSPGVEDRVHCKYLNPLKPMGRSSSFGNKNLQQGTIISGSCYGITQMPEQWEQPLTWRCSASSTPIVAQVKRDSRIA